MVEPKSWLDKLLAEDEKARVRAEKQQRRQEAAAQRRVVSEDLLKVRATQELFRRKPQIWVDDFDLSALDEPLVSPETREVLDWEGEFFRRSRTVLKQYSIDDLLIARISRVEESLRREAAWKQEEAQATEKEAQRQSSLTLLQKRADERRRLTPVPSSPATKPAAVKPTTEKAATTQPAPTNGVKPTADLGYDSGTDNRKSLPRTCPRCRGSMIHEVDRWGAFASCFNCGYTQEAVIGPPIDVEEPEDQPKQRHRQPSHGKMKL